MSTNCLTYVCRGRKPIVCMYRHWDGYLSEHGKDLASFLSGMTVINGISGQKMGEAANGMDCLAAQLVANFKKDIGNVYLVECISKNVMNEYTYYIYNSASKKIKDNSKRLMIKAVSKFHGLLYHGPAHKFLAFIDKEKEKENS